MSFFMSYYDEKEVFRLFGGGVIDYVTFFQCIHGYAFGFYDFGGPRGDDVFGGLMQRLVQ